MTLWLLPVAGWVALCVWLRHRLYPKYERPKWGLATDRDGKVVVVERKRRD